MEPVGVLVLVDQHVVEALADMSRQARVADHLRPVEQQVVVIEHALRLLGLHIAREQLPQLFLPGGAPGEMLLQHGLQRHLGVDGAGVDRRGRCPLVGKRLSVWEKPS